MAATFIGGNLDAISSSADSMTETGRTAMASGDQTRSAADELSGSIEAATKALFDRFSSIASELQTSITTAHRQLEGADWQGGSRDAAVKIKTELQTQVNKVLDTATTNITAEQRAFTDRAGMLVDHVEVEFRGVMRQVDTEYGALAQAARDTRTNLEAADQTIRMT